MGTILASAVIAQTLEVLQDTEGVTYTETQALAWLNDAQRAVSLVRPDAKSVTQLVSLTTGDTRHILPPGARRLLGVIRNMGAGSTVGAAIRGPVSQEEMDAADPNWHSVTGTAVRSYVYDEATPLEFYTYPKIASSWTVLAKLAMHPDDVVDAADPIDLADEFAPAMREWMLYCFYARDHENTPNWAKAGRHFQGFFQLLGIQSRADMAVSPKVIEYGKQLAAGGQ